MLNNQTNKDMKLGIFETTWANKGNKPAVAFEIKEVAEIAPGYGFAPIKGGKSTSYIIEISEDVYGDKVATTEVIKNYLSELNIEVANMKSRLSIK